MKKLFFPLLTALIFGACTSDDPSLRFGPNTPGGDFETGSTDAEIAGLTDFNVAFDYQSLNENETIPSDDEDYIENSESGFVATVNIVYDGSKVPSISGVTDDVTVVTDGANVVATAKKSCKFVLSGKTSNGRFKLYSEKKSAVVLNGVDITNETGAAINIQSKKRTFLVVADGTENTLTDGTLYVMDTDPSDATSTEKQKGTYYSKGQTVVSGSGRLNIYANYKHGIDTKDYLRIRKNTNIYVKAVASNCIKCEDTDADGGIIIEGGVLNLDNQATAGKGLSSDGEITVRGGRITAICLGDGEWDGDDAEVKDVSGAAGIKADGAMYFGGGEIWVMSNGKGGKGINGDADIHFDGGVIHAKTTGEVFAYTYNGLTYDTSPKGIKSDKNIYVDGATIYVAAIGASEGSEGIEAKETFMLNDGDVKVYAVDDGVNAGYSSEGLRNKQQLGYDISGLKADAGQVIINGGTIFAYSSSNDGIDSNGTITINGGTAISFGANQPEEGFDCDQNTFAITGGTVIGVGGASSNPTESACKQPCVLMSSGIQSGTTYTVTNASGKTIATFIAPRSYNNATVLLSSPSFEKGGSYSFGNTSFTCSSSSWVTGSSGGFGGGPGGNRPGGGPGGW